jgi:hypothetical protein
MHTVYHIYKLEMCFHTLSQVADVTGGGGGGRQYVQNPLQYCCYLAERIIILNACIKLQLIGHW